MFRIASRDMHTDLHNNHKQSDVASGSAAVDGRYELVLPQRVEYE